jgi:hypothetical protein
MLCYRNKEGQDGIPRDTVKNCPLLHSFFGKFKESLFTEDTHSSSSQLEAAIHILYNAGLR